MQIFHSTFQNYFSATGTSYAGGDYSALEYVFVDNEHYRLMKNFYDGPTFTTLAGRAEYAELNADPNDECYVTSFDYNGVAETITYPSGNRQNIKVYNSEHQLRAEYVYDTVHDANSMANAYTYENSYPTSHTGPLGRTTEYSYSAAGYLCAELEVGNDLGIDPNTSRLKNIYDIDGAGRTIGFELRLCDSCGTEGRLIRQIDYDFNDTVGDLEWGTVKSETLSCPAENVSEVTSYRYNSARQVTRKMGPSEKMEGSSYNQAGQVESTFVISSVSDMDDENDELVLVTQTRYSYNGDGNVIRLEKAVDDEPFDYGEPTGWVVTGYEYDFLGRRTAVIEDAEGEALRTEYEYNSQNEVIKTTYPQGSWLESEYDGRGFMVRQKSGYGQGTERVEVAVTNYEHNADGDLVEQTGPDGTVTYREYNNLGQLIRLTSGNRVIDYVRDGAGNVVSESYTDSDSGDVVSRTETEYERRGREFRVRKFLDTGDESDTEDSVSLYRYDIFGNLAEAIKKGPGCGDVEAVEGGDVVTQSRYDDLNRLRETVDAAGNEVVYDYYAGGQLFSISKDIDAEPNSVELLVTQKNYYDDAGQEDVVFDAAGNYLVKSYDSLGRVLVEWAYDGKGTADYGDDTAARQIRYIYDNSGKVLRKAIIANAGQSLIAAIDCAVDNVTEYDYDGLGRLSAKTTYYGGGDLLTAVSSYEYDGLGRLTASVDPAGNETVNAYDALGRVVLVEKNYASGTDSLTVTTERLYDGLGRLSEVRRIPEATVPGEYLATVYEYDVRDNLERITDPNGTITVFGYDGLGRQVLKIADFGSGRINQTTEFGYDRLGRQIYVSAWPDETNPTGVQTTTYQYDKLNRLTLVTYPNDSECGYSYDVLGRTIERRDRREWLTEYEYDNLGRLTQRKSYDGQNELIATETFGYDALGNLLNIAKIADGKNISSSVFTYNSLSLITSETTALFDESAVIAQYDYDQAGLLVGQSGGGGGESINYSREALGRINTITRDNGVEPPCPIAAYTYLGPQTQEIYFDNAGLTQTLSYNNLEQIIGIANVPADSDETLEYHYEYDRAGNRIEIEYTHLSPAKYDLFGYDRLGRLRKAQYGVSDSLVMREVKGLGPLPREFGGLDGLEWAGTAAEIWLINEFRADVGVKEYSKLDGQHSIDEILRLKFRDENWNRMLRNVLHDHRPMVRALELGADFDRKESRSEKLIDKFGNIHEFIIQTQTGRLLTWIITPENQKSESFVHAEVFYYDKRRQTLFRVNFGDGSYIDMHLKYNQKGQMTAQTNKEYDRAGNLKKTWQVPVAEVELQTFSASSSEIYLLSVPIPEALSELVESFSYDDLSNRVNHQLGGESPLNDTYTINNLNQYTQITHSDDSYHTCDYDPAGNLRRDMNDYHYYYDEESRLVEIRGADDLTMVAAYDYDGLGRRVRRLRRMPGGEVEESLYYYDNRERVIAEYEKAASEDDFEISRCFVYGNNIDEALAMYEPGNAAEGDESDLLLLIGLGESWLCDANDADFDGDFDYDDSNFVDLRDFAYLSQGWSYVPAREEKTLVLSQRRSGQCCETGGQS